MPEPELHDAIERARRIKVIGFDVDGVLTDGRLWYDNDGGESKAFHVHDGLGLRLLARAGIATCVISARASAATERRLRELGVEHVYLGVADKRPLFEQICRDLGHRWFEAAYMGDDLPDLAILVRVHLAATVRHAPAALRERCHFIATRPAGAGAVREFAEFVLVAQGRLDALVEAYLGGGR